MRSRASSQAGFSFIEVVVAITILVIASGTAIVLTNSVLPGIRADSQGRRLIAMMQYARGMATSSRRDVELRFDVPSNAAQLVLMDAGLERPIQRLDFEYHVRFAKFPGLGDTPDGFGDADVVDFGGATRIVFEPDGSVIDETGLPVNGTVFLGMDGEVHAARAITLTGTTARGCTTGRARQLHQDAGSHHSDKIQRKRIRTDRSARRALDAGNGALKVVNGQLGNLLSAGLTIAAENPVYVEGHYNANAAGFGGPYVASAIMADAITLLSVNWSIPQLAQLTGGAGTVWIGHGDTRSFNDPNDTDSHLAGTTRYRFAALSGKIKAFPQPGLPASFGTDGGVHNFLHMLEDWSDDTTHYLGSIASFFHSRQAGLFRCCNNVYEIPNRNFQFETNFLTPSLLPPKTPMFRDVNTTRFRHVTR